jgi:hypothetical protein
MKQKSTSQSAFFNLRVLIGLFAVLTGVFLALIGLGAFSGITASSAKAQQTHKIIDVPGLPPGFDCATIHEKGIDRMENLGAGLIMIACGEAPGGSPSILAGISQAIQRALPPDTFGGTDVDLITGTETFPHVTQSETYSSTNPDNPSEIVVTYNDSRSATSNNFSGASVSEDGGATFTRLTKSTGQSPFANTFGDPVALYNKPSGTWFATFIDGGCGGFGIGGYKSTTPSDPNSWTHFCVHSNSADDRESGWADNNTSSPNFGHMYVSYNDFNVGGGALFVRVSTDNGTTWTPHQLTSGFLRDVQITGDSATGNVYLAAMNEGGGGTGGPRSNLIFRSTNGGTNWTNTFTSSTFTGPSDGSLCSDNSYFAAMFNGYWRHMGWGEPAALNGVVHYVYAQHGAGSDPGDVYYIRSTDSGMTFSAPLKLNTDTTTRPQWQPNISVSSAGTVFAIWYDARESTSCSKGNPGVPCYRMWARKSTDNGATWLPDAPFSDVVTPLPGQPDSSIVTCYAGDYDYASALDTDHQSAWVDGRVTISSQSQQDPFFDQEPTGAGGIPCGDLVSFQVRCVSGTRGDKLQAKLTLTNTSHSGQQVTITVDSTPHTVTISGNKATLSINGEPTGTHTVTLTNPAGCFPPQMPSCP